MLSSTIHSRSNLNRSIFNLSPNYSLMKKLLLLLLILFSACYKIPDSLIEPQSINYKVDQISVPQNISYSFSDSSFVASVKIINAQSVSAVWCRVYSLDGTLKITDYTVLYDDGNLVGHGDQTKGDGIYSAKIVMGKLKPAGKYQIEFFVENNIQLSPDNISKAGSHVFTYDNSQVNYPPVLSNLILPQQVNRGEGFIFSVKVSDQNGLADISQVYFKLYRPDGTIVMNGTLDYFLMVDNGDLNLGDQTAGDGIFSFKNSFGATAPTGSWKFEFYAKDRSNSLGNVLTQTTTVN